MAAIHIVSLRVPQSLIDRSDALNDALVQEEESLLVGRLSRSIVMRLALVRGLEVLERQVANRAAAHDSEEKPTAKTRGRG